MRQPIRSFNRLLVLEEDIEYLRQDALPLLRVQGALAVEAYGSVRHLRGRYGIGIRNIVTAHDAPQRNLVLVLVLPDGLGSLDNHIAVGLYVDHRDRYTTARTIRARRRALRLEIVRAANGRREDIIQEIEDADARLHIHAARLGIGAVPRRGRRRRLADDDGQDVAHVPRLRVGKIIDSIMSVAVCPKGLRRRGKCRQQEQR